MTTIADVFKMFPNQILRISKPEKSIKKKPKTINSCFSEGIQYGCKAFTIEMGHQLKK